MSDSALDEIIPLGETGDYINGIGFKESDWNGAGLPIIRIQNLTNEEKPFNFTSREVDEKYHVRNGDILVSWSATLDAFVWRRGPALLNQHIFKVVPRQDSIDPRFLYYQLKSIIYSMSRGEHAHGSTMKHINRKPFLAHPFWRPCLEKQEEIGQWLDAQFSGLDETERTLQAIQAKIKQARASILKAAVEGRLVAAGIRTNIECKPYVVKEICLSKPSNGKSVPTGDGFPVLRLTAMKDGRIDITEIKNGAWTEESARPYVVQQGDFFVMRGSGSLSRVGDAAIAMDAGIKAAFPDTMIRLQPDPRVCHPAYLLLCWRSPDMRTRIERSAKTTAGIYKINQRDISGYRIDLPDLVSQRSILEEVERRFSILDQVEATVNASLKRCSQLRQAVLMRAFFLGGGNTQDQKREVALA